MNRSSAVDDAGGGGGDKKKREKKGFKVDRYENFQRKISKKITGKDQRKSSSASGKRVKSIAFDDASRREYLLTMHKKKNERRVKAFVDAKRKVKRDNAKVRRSQREEARQAYNRFAAVPILPNFTYQLPHDPNSNLEDNMHSESEVEVEDINTEEVDEEENKEKVKVMQREAAKKRRSLIVAEKSVHILPSAMRGEGNKNNNNNKEEEEEEEAPLPQSSRLDDDYITVEVKPLFARPAAGGNKAPLLPGNDFSDLPTVVEQELLRLKKETKGPSKTKPRVRMLKELEKIRKIKKHSRKGHGKKTAKGKKSHRK